MDLGAPVRITREMYHDLSSADLFEMFNPHRYGENAVAMVHGAKDNVIDPKAAKAFAEQFHIPVTILENEGHSLSGTPDTPERVADLAISFYEKDIFTEGEDKTENER